MEMHGPGVTVINPTTLDNHEHFKVMQWPANTCFGCSHQDCVRRRRERNIPCANCGAKVLNGQEYRVTSHVGDEITTVIHRTCERRRWPR